MEIPRIPAIDFDEMDKFGLDPFSEGDCQEWLDTTPKTGKGVVDYDRYDAELNSSLSD